MRYGSLSGGTREVSRIAAICGEKIRGLGEGRERERVRKGKIEGLGEGRERERG